MASSRAQNRSGLLVRRAVKPSSISDAFPRYWNWGNSTVEIRKPVLNGMVPEPRVQIALIKIDHFCVLQSLSLSDENRKCWFSL